MEPGSCAASRSCAHRPPTTTERLGIDHLDPSHHRPCRLNESSTSSSPVPDQKQVPSLGDSGWTCYGSAARSPSGSIDGARAGWRPRDGAPEPAILGSATLGATDVHSAIRANCDRIVTRETPTHEYATIAACSGAD